MDKQSELREIIRGCCENQPRSQSLLYKELYRLAMNTAMRYSRDEDDAANIVTAGFVKMFRNIKAFDAGKGTIHGWLKKIIINEALDFLKVRQKFSRYEEVDETTPGIADSGMTEKLGATELLELTRMLPVTTQTIFNMYVIEGYTHREIAGMLGISDGTSKWHLNQARKFLQREITNLSGA
ncbi:MAG: sigma-70 family RNA polymerase sigma factor [Chitinophagales bacterium]|nr:sigma-70 family RNA polymerase sigma factor [Chitinophagales bacterium]